MEENVRPSRDVCQSASVTSTLDLQRRDPPSFPAKVRDNSVRTGASVHRCGCADVWRFLGELKRGAWLMEMLGLWALGVSDWLQVLPLIPVT